LAKSGLSPAQLHELARRGATVRLEELRAEIAAVQALLGASSGRAARRAPTGKEQKSPSRRRGKLSPAGRAAIAAAQKARWAKIKSAKSQGSTSADAAGAANAAAPAARKRGGMSRAARKAAAARMKKYWAEKRKAGAKKKK
jgi:hypothetical protein